MKWNEEQQKWLMLKKKDSTMLQEFFDCANVRRVFKGLDKTVPHTYNIEITKMEDE